MFTFNGDLTSVVREIFVELTKSVHIRVRRLWLLSFIARVEHLRWSCVSRIYILEIHILTFLITLSMKEIQLLSPCARCLIRCVRKITPNNMLYEEVVEQQEAWTRELYNIQRSRRVDT